MLTFFFLLVFIAEVKITYDLVVIIRRFDRKICEINETLVDLNPKLQQSVTQLRIAINTVLLNVIKIKQKIAEKKEKYKYKLLKNIITAVLFLCLNISGKKAMTYVELAFTAKDFIKACLKVFHSLKK